MATRLDNAALKYMQSNFKEFILVWATNKNFLWKHAKMCGNSHQFNQPVDKLFSVSNNIFQFFLQVRLCFFQPAPLETCTSTHSQTHTHTRTRSLWRWKRHLCQRTGYTNALSRTLCVRQFVCNSVSFSFALSLFLFSYVVQTSNRNRSRWFLHTHTHIFENGFCIKTKESVNGCVRYSS